MRARYFLVGATASGKKAIALRLAPRLDAALLSLDSIKVYRGMDRGTDKAAPGRFGLTDLVEPDQAFSVGSYVRAAREAVAELDRQDRAALFVGGTGLYLRALVQGLFEGPDVPEEIRQDVRRRLREQGSATLHHQLRQVDPRIAERLHPNDGKRIVRALEMFEATGRPLSVWQEEETRPGIPGECRLVGLRWSPETLRRRIDARVDRMFERGLVEEVRALHEAERLGEVAREAIGYREVVDHLRGTLDRAECRDAIRQHTWSFARRQMNWFRQFPSLRWVEAEGQDEEAQVEAAEQAFRPAAG